MRTLIGVIKGVLEKLNTIPLKSSKNLIKHRKDFKIFLVVFTMSLILSLYLLVSRVDQDFFVFYYIGKGVVHGMDMYRDFADNKGPVLYVLFSLLNRIFSNNYRIALVVGSTVLDSLSIFLIVKVLNKFFKLELPVGFRKILVLIVLTTLYKGFSIGYVGGIYSESVVYPLFLVSLLLLPDRKILSGVFMGFSILTRQTLIGMLPFTVYVIATNQNKKKNTIKYLLGIFFPVIVFFSIYTLRGHFEYVFDNFIVRNLHYINITFSDRLTSFTSTLIAHPHIVFSYEIIIVYFIYSYKKRKNNKFRLITILLLASLLTTYLTSYVFYHHFIQMTLFVFLAVLTLEKSRKMKMILNPLYFLIFFSVVLAASSQLYYSDWDECNGFIDETITLNSDKHYLLAVPHYPELNVLYERFSPDRYFYTHQLSSWHNKGSEANILLHKNIPKDNLKSTLFLVFHRHQQEDLVSNEYLDNFYSQFKLEKVGTCGEAIPRIDVYESRV